MFVPAWVVWTVAVVVLGPPALFLAWAGFIGTLTAIFPPKPGSIIDPMGEKLARGKPEHAWFATPYLPEGHPFRNPPVTEPSPSRQNPGAPPAA